MQIHLETNDQLSTIRSKFIYVTITIELWTIIVIIGVILVRFVNYAFSEDVLGVIRVGNRWKAISFLCRLLLKVLEWSLQIFALLDRRNNDVVINF